MTIAGITAVICCCLFIGIQSTLAIILMLITAGVASQAPVLLVLLGITIIAGLLTRKR